VEITSEFIKTMTAESIKNYWEQFLASLPPDSPYHLKTYVAEGWGIVPEWRMNLAR
jgi:hypothetical protein